MNHNKEASYVIGFIRQDIKRHEEAIAARLRPKERHERKVAEVRTKAHAIIIGAFQSELDNLSSGELYTFTTDEIDVQLEDETIRKSYIISPFFTAEMLKMIRQSSF